MLSPRDDLQTSKSPAGGAPTRADSTT